MRNYFWVPGILFLLIFNVGVLGQDQVVVVNRSETIQVINGRPFYFHAVTQGQTLFRIALAYGVSEEAIEKENPDLENGLRYDQIILIPASGNSSAPQSPQGGQQATQGEFIEHTVKRHDTIYGLARQYGVTMEEILVYNPDASSGLRPRQVLRIPVKKDIPSVAHTVTPGETLFRIAVNYGLSVDDLFAANPGLTSDISPGQIIRIPEKKGVPATIEEPVMVQGLVFVVPEEVHEEEEVDEPLCGNSTLKDSYNVALFIPLYLEELDTLPEVSQMTPHHKSFAFIDYYNGVLMALDSIKTVNRAKITLHVFDVDQSVEKARDAVNSRGFSEMDMIIGPFFSQPLSFVAGYGQRNGIPVISPLNDDNKLLKGFPNLFQVSPSLQAQLSDMAHYISHTYTDQNIILVHNRQKQAEGLISGFQKELEAGIRSSLFHQDSLNLARVNGYFINGSLVGDRRTNVLVMNDSIFEVRSKEFLPEGYFRQNPMKEVIFAKEGIEGLTAALDPDKKNVIITLIGGEAFLSDYLRQLNQITNEYDMVVFGTRAWQDYQNIEIEYLQNLQVHIFENDFLDFRDPHIRKFVLRYREIFHTEPHAYAFKGAQTAWFFLNALVHYGTDFPSCIHLINSNHYENPFSFSRPQGSSSGWENQRTTLFRYQDYRKVDVRRSERNTTGSNR